MTEDVEGHDAREQNRRAWNSIGGRRDEVRQFPPGRFFRDGGTMLDPLEVDALGDVTGQRLAHLGCASGCDSLSWAVQGAVVTGIDFSHVAIERAQARAAEAEIAASFILADVLNLPADLDLDRFDIVYVSSGLLCWLPDISAWAATVADLLRTGGRLLLHDIHPLMLATELKGSMLRLVSDYFGRATAELVDEPLMTGVATPERRYQFTWPLGDVITSLVTAGMVVTRLEEQPGQRPHDLLPASFLLLAHKG